MILLKISGLAKSTFYYTLSKTDKDNKIVYIYRKFRPDKILFPKRKVSYIYLTPVGASNSFKVGEEFVVKEKE